MFHFVYFILLSCLFQFIFSVFLVSSMYLAGFFSFVFVWLPRIRQLFLLSIDGHGNQFDPFFLSFRSKISMHVCLCVMRTWLNFCDAALKKPNFNLLSGIFSKLFAVFIVVVAQCTHWHAYAFTNREGFLFNSHSLHTNNSTQQSKQNFHKNEALFLSVFVVCVCVFSSSSKVLYLIYLNDNDISYHIIESLYILLKHL